MPRTSVKSLSTITNSRKTITSANSKSKSKSKSYKSITNSIAKIKPSNNRTRKSLSKIIEEPDVPNSKMMSMEQIPTLLPRSEIAQYPSMTPSMIVPQKKTQTIADMSVLFRIYRKAISNLKIRDDILRSVPSNYAVGPTIIWTEIPGELSIFTTEESYTNYIGFEGVFANPKSKNYLKTILEKMRMIKGTILIKEAPDNEASIMNIKVHFCGYRIDENGKFFIFDPSWHSSDKGIYSTTAFYDSLEEYRIKYQHAEPTRKHHWQSLLLNDVFCQTWSLRWLYIENDHQFYLPPTNKTAAKLIAMYMKKFSGIILQNIEKYMSMFPAYKLEGQDPTAVFRTLSGKREETLTEIIYDYFKDKVE